MQLMSIFRRAALTPATAPADKQQPKAPEPGRTAPDPLSIILPAIAALGAIAGIAAVAWLAEDRTADRPRVKRRTDMVLKDLETSCLGLAEILRRVIRHSPMFGLLGAAGATPMKFGINGARIDAAQSQTFIHLVNDVATMLVLATQASFDTANAIEDGDINPPEELLYRFGEVQEKLNKLMSARDSIKSTVEGALAHAETLCSLVRELKGYQGSGG